MQRLQGQSPLVRSSARRAVEAADIGPLALAVVQLTGDETILDLIEPHIRGTSEHAESLPASAKQRIREQALAALELPGAGEQNAPMMSREVLLRMMGIATGQAMSAEYLPVMIAQSAFGDARTVGDEPLPRDAAQKFQVVVIGAGMSGICAGIALKRLGIPFVIYEKNAEVGGTWLENTYPGCGVDTPSHFYSFSFEPNAGWSHYFAKRQEIVDYFATCARKYGIRDAVRFGTEVVRARFLEDAQAWEVAVRHGDGREQTLRASAVISAVGQLNRAAVPDIAGLADFKGPCLHSAQWDAARETNGIRVAMIGTGASGMQIAPAIAQDVASLTIFQRSPHWVLPNPNYHRTVSDDQKWLFANFPFYARWYRLQLFWSYGDAVYPALHVDPEWRDQHVSINGLSERFRQNMIRHINRELADRPDLIPKVTPTYPPYGKRVLLDNNWYQTLKRDNVAIVTEPIASIDADAVVTHDGTRHPADMIVLATGFQASRMLWPMQILGRGGVSLRDLWGADDPRAYLGITVPKFPNLFLIYGPNTNLGHGGSAIFHTECQVHYIMQCLQALVRNRWSSLECRQEVHDAYNERVDAMHRNMVWAHKGVSNWYRNAKGRVTANSPWRLVDYYEMTRRPDFNDFVVVRPVKRSQENARAGEAPV